MNKVNVVLTRERDEAIASGNYAMVAAIDNYLGNLVEDDPLFLFSQADFLNASKRLEGIVCMIQCPHRNGSDELYCPRTCLINAREIEGNSNESHTENGNLDTRVYGDLGPISGRFVSRRMRSKPGEKNENNMNLYVAAKAACITPENAYQNPEVVRRLLLNYRHISAVTVGSEARESIYSENTNSKVIETFISCYRRGEKLVQQERSKGKNKS